MTADQIQKLLMPLAVTAGWLLLAYFVSRYAKGRGRRQWLWFTVAVVVNPILTALIIVMLPNKLGERAQDRGLSILEPRGGG